MKEDVLKGFSPSKALLPAAACLSSILAIHLYFISKIVSSGGVWSSLQMKFTILVLLTVYAMIGCLAIIEHYDAKYTYIKLMEAIRLLPDETAVRKLFADSILFPKTAFYLVYVGLTIFTAVYFCLATFILKFFITTELWILMILTVLSMTFMIVGFLSTEVVSIPTLHQELEGFPKKEETLEESKRPAEEKKKEEARPKEKLFEALEEKAEETSDYDEVLERMKKQRKIITVKLEEDKEPAKESRKEDDEFAEESELLRSLKELQEVLRDLKGKVKKTQESAE
ncbi:MAG TPA: hypothetical protein ENF56_01570 [Candidatus Bathyarchaeota archaeon]|nr:hypothetical protein [Candidatus Bathyarchaeota archaeon]